MHITSSPRTPLSPFIFASGVILAAGESRRLGRAKQLLPLAGKPVIHWVAEIALASHLSEVVVVVGAEAEAVTAAVADLSVRVVLNERFADGQSTSLRAGLAAVSDKASAVVFLLGDQPEVQPAVIDRLIAACEATGAPIVQPVYGNTPGNPVLFDRSLFPELEHVAGDQGARALLRRGPEWVFRVTVSGGPPPGDIDTDEDYRALVDRWAKLNRDRR